MTGNHVNGLFEGFGALLMWNDVLRLLRDRTIRGVWWPARGFFAAWGLWNLWYYPSLGQWWSFAGGVGLVAGNVVWCALALRFRR